jgi:hypothetical protein
MIRWTVLAFLAVTLSLSGCRPDYKRIADEHVEANLLEQYESREAIAFFEERGRLFDADDTTRVDQQVVLPLLKQLNEVAPTQQWALLRPEDQDAAMVVLVELPPDPPTVDRMAEVVQAADDKFSGFIVQQWGHTWLMFNLIDQQAYEFLKKNQPEIDRQR